MLRSRLCSLAFAVVPGCFSPGDPPGDGTAGATESTSDGGEEAATAPSEGPDGPSTMGPADDSETAPSDCGNGAIDGDEQCDDGAANSDSEPNACRTDCTAHRCGDGVIDDREACDDADANSDTSPDACRTSCALPSCGDAAIDRSETCDDGNAAWGDACFECESRFYFVLNAPSTNSSGDDSIVRVVRDGSTVPLLGPDPAYNGMRELEVEPDGSALYAMQSNFAVVQHRILVIDPETGVVIDEIAVDTGLGVSVSLAAMARGANGLLYLVALASSPSNTHFVSVDPETGTVMDTFTWNFTVQIGDMTADANGWYYVTNLTDELVYRVSPAFSEVGIFSSGFPSPFGITYDPASDTLWVAANAPSAEAEIVRIDAATGGMGTPYATIAGMVQPDVRGLIVDGSTPLVTLGVADTVAAVDAVGVATPVFTDQIDYPVDIKIVDLSR